MSNNLESSNSPAFWRHQFPRRKRCTLVCNGTQHSSLFLSTPCLTPLMLPNAQPGCLDSLAVIFGCWMCSLSRTNWEAGSWTRCSEQKTQGYAVDCCRKFLVISKVTSSLRGMSGQRDGMEGAGKWPETWNLLQHLQQASCMSHIESSPFLYL